MCDFEEALGCLKIGFRITRKEWVDPEWVHYQRPDEHSKMTLPYIYIQTGLGDFVPWLPSQTDLLAEDWEVRACP